MSVIERIGFEVEARRLIARARRINRTADRARGKNTRPSALQWTLGGMSVIALAVNVYVAYKGGAF